MEMKKQFRRQTISLLRLWAIVATRSEWIAAGGSSANGKLRWAAKAMSFRAFTATPPYFAMDAPSKVRLVLKRISVRWGIVAGTDGDAVHALRSF